MHIWSLCNVGWQRLVGSQNSSFYSTEETYFDKALLQKSLIVTSYKCTRVAHVTWVGND